MKLLIGPIAVIFVLAACGGGTRPGLTSDAPSALRTCLRSAPGASLHRVPRGSRLLDYLIPVLPRTVWLLNVGRAEILLAEYATGHAAESAFAAVQDAQPVIQQGNVMLVIASSRQPSPRVIGAIEECTLRRPERATIGGAVTDVRFRVPRAQPRCRLTARYVDSSAGAGMYFAFFALRNGAGRPCLLFRYPTVVFAARRGRPIHSPESRGRNGALLIYPVLKALPARSSTGFELIFGLLWGPTGRPCRGPQAVTALITAGPNATARAPVGPPFSKARQPLSQCPGIDVSTFAPPTR